MCEKHKSYSYFEKFLIFVSTVSGSVSVSPFASLVGVPFGTANFVVEITRCVITAGIKKYESVTKKKKKKLDKIVLLAKIMKNV